VGFGIYRLFLVAVALAITLLLVAALEYTRFGAQVRAAVDNQRMARGLRHQCRRARSRSPSRLEAGLLASAARSRSRSSARSVLRVHLPDLRADRGVVGGLGSIGGSFAAATLIGISDVAGKYYVPELRLRS